MPDPADAQDIAGTAAVAADSPDTIDIRLAHHHCGDLHESQRTSDHLTHWRGMGAASGVAGTQDLSHAAHIGDVKPAAEGNPSSKAVLLALIRLRKLRAALFAEKLFAQPAWDMLLELLECQLRARRISVSSLYLAAGVPPATALRRINDMEAAGLIRRSHDPRDRRRQFVELTPRTRDKLAQFFQDAKVRAALQIDDRGVSY